MTIIHIQDSVYIDVKLGGKEVLGYDMFEEILVIENVLSVPAASITFNDSVAVTLKDLQLTDGLQLELTVSKTPDDNSTPQNFRLFGDNGSRAFRSGQKSKAHFLIDAPKFFGKTVRKAVKGNSSDAMRQLASDCGLEYDGDGTQDEQIWFGAHETYRQWARDIASYGFITDTSCMLPVLTANKKLLYKNINQIMQSGESKKSLYTSFEVPTGDPDALLIYANRSKTNSGFMNSWLNYGYTFHTHGITGKDEKHESIEAVKRESFLAQSSDMKSEIEIARIDMSHFDCSNTHENYYKAWYQNMRYRALFSECMSVIIHDYSDLNLLDIVRVYSGDTVGGPAEKIEETVKSGYYMVVGKTKVIRNGILYGERLELLRNSTRSVGINSLVG